MLNIASYSLGVDPWEEISKDTGKSFLMVHLDLNSLFIFYFLFDLSVNLILKWKNYFYWNNLITNIYWLIINLELRFIDIRYNKLN